MLGGFLLLAVLATLAIGLFYEEEDARGAHEWSAAKASLQKAGESIDYNDLIPPEIPSDQNLGAIPLFQVEIDSKTDVGWQASAMKKALANIAPNYDSLPKVGSWLKGEATEMRLIDKYLADRYTAVFSVGNGKLGPMEEFDALCPALTDLRHEAQTKTQCRFLRDYTTEPPYNRPLGPVTQLIKLTKIINLHALVALHESKSDVALDDDLLVLKINTGVRREPLLVSGLVAAGSVSIQLGSIWEALGMHALSDSQLAELQQQLQRIDYLSDYQLCLRGEATGFFVQTNDYMREHRRSASDVIFTIISPNNDPFAENNKPTFWGILTGWLLPNGWFDMAKARGVTLYFRAARSVVDTNAHLVYPEMTNGIKQQVDSLNRFYFPDLMLRIAAPPVIGSIEAFAQVQSRIDAATIACALERYRLAHGSYPESLDKLSPYAPQGLPLDLMNGEPYHYKLLPDGNYLLYSVGWNQIDDGGKVAYQPGDSNVLDREQGDWVWPNPKMK